MFEKLLPTDGQVLLIAASARATNSYDAQRMRSSGALLPRGVYTERTNDLDVTLDGLPTGSHLATEAAAHPFCFAVPASRLGPLPEMLDLSIKCLKSVPFPLAYPPNISID